MSKNYILESDNHPIASSGTEPPEETREELFTNAPELHADKEFADEMKIINRAERKHQEKLAAADKAEQKAAQKAREAEVKEALAKPQTLDPDDIKERVTEKARRENLSKLYPDPIPMRDDIEEKLKEKDKDKFAGGQPRAKIETIYNDKLHRYLTTAIAVQVIGFITYIFCPFLGNVSDFISLISAAAILGSIALIELGANTCKNKYIPQEQRNTFIFSTLIPALFVRLTIAFLIMLISSNLPVIGGYAGMIAGYFLGSALHYNYIFKRGVQSEIRMVLYNTLCFALLQFGSYLPFVFALGASTAMELYNSIYSIYGLIISFGIFIAADIFAAKTSPGQYK